MRSDRYLQVRPSPDSVTSGVDGVRGTVVLNSMVLSAAAPVHPLGIQGLHLSLPENSFCAFLQNVH